MDDKNAYKYKYDQMTIQDELICAGCLIKTDADCNLCIDGRYICTLYANEPHREFFTDSYEHLIQCIATNDIIVEKVFHARSSGQFVVVANGLREQLIEKGREMWKLMWRAEYEYTSYFFIDYCDKKTMEELKDEARDASYFYSANVIPLHNSSLGAKYLKTSSLHGVTQCLLSAGAGDFIVRTYRHAHEN